METTPARPTDAATATAPLADGTAPKPTVVLVHGAFADASGWSGVIDRLLAEGFPVVAVANPLRALGSDSAYLRSILDAIDGDTVLVGHSYGGAVITNAAAGAGNVVGLVYIAAFAPDRGEKIADFLDPEKYPGEQAGPDDFVFRPFATGLDVTIATDRFQEIFAADLPESVAQVLAVSQRPATASTMEEASGEPAWKTLPSWYQISTRDHAISPAAQRMFAQRMGANTTSIDASHAGYISHPDATAEVIKLAALSTR